MELKNISEQVKILLEDYDFNADTLGNYLGLSTEQIRDIASGNADGLLRDHTVIDKIMFLYVITVEGDDVRTSAFLEVLISYHHLSKTTLAKMARVEVSDIEKMLSNPPVEVDVKTKYKIAATAMGLRFFLKESEPPIESDFQLSKM